MSGLIFHSAKSPALSSLRISSTSVLRAVPARYKSKKASAPAPAPAAQRPAPPITSGAAPSSAGVRAQAEALTWPEYLKIRANKRRWEMGMTIPTTFLAFGGAIFYFGNLDTDISKPIMGFDPMFFYGFATVGIGGLGYLVGPVLGSACWRMSNRSAMTLFEARDREFYRHIIKNRADPSAQSTSNPVPDYYGEKIGSLAGYRQWLRDQARYRRKARWEVESSESLR